MIFGSSNNYLYDNGRNKKFKRKLSDHYIQTERKADSISKKSLYDPGKISTEKTAEKTADEEKKESTKMASTSFHGASEDWPLAYSPTGPLYGPYAGGPSHSSLLSLDEFPSSSYWSSSMALVDNYELGEERYVIQKI